MKILIITFGSLGDVQPYVALGKGLKAAGHVVTICTACRFEPFITSHGIEYGYMTDELLRLMDTDVGRDAIEDTVGLLGVLRTVLKIKKYLKPLTKEMIIDSWKAAQAADPDIVVFHPKASGAVSIAEKLNIPAIMANLQPMIVPTSEFPIAGVPSLKLGGWYNRATYSLISLGVRMYSKIVNDFRKDMLDLDSFPKSSGMLYTAKGKPVPILHGYSPHVIPRPGDWPDHVSVNGYWFLDPMSQWKPSLQLQTFLEEGEPPVYIGFGSMVGRNPERLANIAIEALQKNNLRGILSTGRGGIKASHLPDGILEIDMAPHSWLFPRMSAIVHHGGAGTRGAALLAGKPMVICPFIADQPFWGERIHSLGVGPKPIPQKKLSVSRLGNALNEVSNNLKMQEQSVKLSQQIQDDNGVKNAVAAIEKVLKEYKK